MFDDCLETARQMIVARHPEHVEAFNSDVKELDYEMARKFQGGFASWYVSAYRDICLKHLKKSGEFIFNTYKENLVGFGISIPPNDERLVEEFKSQFMTFYRFVFNRLVAKVKDKNAGWLFNSVSVENNRNTVILDYTARIHLLHRQLTHESTKPPNMKIEVSGDNNNVQVGNNNTQNLS